MRNVALKVSLACVFSALTCVGAWIKIPISLVPVTLQTLFVHLSGLLLGASLGALSQLVYVLLGVVGLPVFAKGGGIAYLVGPTGGYLLGFIASAYVTGLLDGKTIKRCLISSLAGLCVIYMMGVAVLSTWVGGLWRALAVGVAPFVIGDVLKAISASYIAVKLKPVVKTLLGR